MLQIMWNWGWWSMISQKGQSFPIPEFSPLVTTPLALDLWLNPYSRLFDTSFQSPISQLSNAPLLDPSSNWQGEIHNLPKWIWGWLWIVLSTVSQGRVGFVATYPCHPFPQTIESSYLVIPKFLSEEDTHSLLSRSKQLLDEFNIDDHPRVSSATFGMKRGHELCVVVQTKFTTSDDNHVGDDYFLNSGDKMCVIQVKIPNTPHRLCPSTLPIPRSRYFLEEDAVDAQGKLTREKQKSVNKIGHGE